MVISPGLRELVSRQGIYRQICVRLMRKVVENPPQFRGYPHPIKALNDCQETLKGYLKVLGNLT